MTPSEAAIRVAEELDDRTAWNHDRIEVAALDIAAEAFRNFAKYLALEEEE